MIHVDDLTFSYGSRSILDHLSFHIEKGGFYALMGPNGCGKTTLLRCIAHLLKPQQGTIRIEGKLVHDYDARSLAQHIAMVRQQTVPDFEFSAFDIVMMGRNPYQRRLQATTDADFQIVENAMQTTHTWHLRDHLPSQMSGGELQRVMIARALAQQTPIMLLDEPTSNLDIAHQLEIMQLLQAINRTEGKTILIVVHDLNQALRYCPQSLLLHQGHLFYQGHTPQALTPQHILEVFGVEASSVEGFLHYQRSSSN